MVGPESWDLQDGLYYSSMKWSGWTVFSTANAEQGIFGYSGGWRGDEMRYFQNQKLLWGFRG